MSSFLGGESKAPSAPAPTMPVPAYADIAKAANDLLNKDFYHTAAANLEVKSKAPNGVNFTVKGKSAHEGAVTGSLEGKKTDKPNGITSFSLSRQTKLSNPAHSLIYAMYFMPSIQSEDYSATRGRKTKSRKTKDESQISAPEQPLLSSEASAAPSEAVGAPPAPAESHAVSHCTPARLLIMHDYAGITTTVAWSTINAVDAKVELDGTLAKDVKLEGLATFKPETQDTSAKVNLFFKQPAFHLRAFIDALKGPTATVDAVIGHEGFVVGGEAGYDVNKAAVTKYAASVGYLSPEYTAAVTATNNLSVFTASYFHKVSSQVQAGAKAAYDSKSAGTVGLELAGKYQLDPLSFVKGKVNDRGVAAVSYNTKVNSGFTLGLGASFDTQKLNQASHKVGANFVFES